MAPKYPNNISDVSQKLDLKSKFKLAFFLGKIQTKAFPKANKRHPK